MIFVSTLISSMRIHTYIHKYHRVGGDTVAYKATERLHQDKYFKYVGYYFQTTLLKSLACWNEETYLIANHRNRKTIVAAIEKMLRLSEAAGRAHFTYHLRGSGGSKQTVIEFPLRPLSERSIKLMDYLRTIKIDEVLVPEGKAVAVAKAPLPPSPSPRKDYTATSSLVISTDSLRTLSLLHYNRTAIIISSSSLERR